MIPSENYVSRAVREANGSVFTNKYSEGYRASAIMVVRNILTLWSQLRLNEPKII